MMKSAFLAGVITLNTGILSAQDYPAKPIRFIANPAGGPNDTVARVIAQGISGPLGQTVIIDNRPSALMGELAFRAAPDGYTILLASSTFTYGSLMRDLPYDPVRDFLPITLASSAPNILVVHPSLPVKSVKELISFAKARPGALNCASSGSGSGNHLAIELFKAMAGVNIVHVPYKGSAPSLGDLLSGQLQLMFTPGTVVTSHVKSGRLRLLAVSSLRPSALYPDVPTVAATLPGYESAATIGVFAPVKTPATVINRLNHEIVQVLNKPEVKEKFLSIGVETVGNTPQELGAWMKMEIARMGKVIKDAGIRGE